MLKEVSLSCLMMSLSASAVYGKVGQDHKCRPDKDERTERHEDRDCTLQAPEMDPSSAAAGLTLLVGGIAVLLGRRSKRIALPSL